MRDNIFSFALHAMVPLNAITTRSSKRYNLEKDGFTLYYRAITYGHSGSHHFFISLATPQNGGILARSMQQVRLSACCPYTHPQLRIDIIPGPNT